MKRFLSLVLLCALLISVLAVPAMADGEVKELSFWHSMGGVNGTMLEQLTDTFNQTIGAANGFKVVPVYQGNNSESHTKLHAMLAANDDSQLPDIMHSPISQLAFIGSLDQLVPLADLVQYAEGLNPDNFLPAINNAFTYRGVQTAAPFTLSTLVMYYNKAHFAEVGLDMTAGPLTLADMGEYCAKLNKVDENGNVTRYGFAGNMSLWYMSSFIGQQKSEYGNFSYMTDNANGYAAPATKAVFGEEGTLETLLREWKNAYDVGQFKYLVGNNKEEFAAGAISMFIDSSSNIGIMLNGMANKEDLGVAYIPRVTEEDIGGVTAGGNSLAVLDNGKGNIKESALFVEYLTSPEVQFQWMAATGYFPVNKGSYDLDEMKAYLVENPLFGIAIDQLNDSAPEITEIVSAMSTNIDSAVQDMFSAVVEGEYTPEEGAEILSEEVTSFLASELE